MYYLSPLTDLLRRRMATKWPWQVYWVDKLTVACFILTSVCISPSYRLQSTTIQCHIFCFTPKLGVVEIFQQSQSKQLFKCHQLALKSSCFSLNNHFRKIIKMQLFSPICLLINLMLVLWLQAVSAQRENNMIVRRGESFFLDSIDLNRNKKKQIIIINLK